MKFKKIIFYLILGLTTMALAQKKYSQETVETSKGALEIIFVGHGTLIFKFGGKVIHIDPWSKVGDYSQLPKADAIFITHSHPDHLDTKAIAQVSKVNTLLFANKASLASLKNAKGLTDSEQTTVWNIPVKSVPAYNLIHKKENGEFWHPKGNGNGYVFYFGDKLVYVAGDTENIPEMKALKNIDVAFLPMNVPYTMTPEMVKNAVQVFKPKTLYPYHTGDTKTALLAELLKENKEIKLVIKDMRIPTK